MTLTLLLDLDGTLLENDLDKFLPSYLDCLGEFMSDYVPPDHFIQNLLVSTSAMIQNIHPDQTLKEVFDLQFFPSLGLDESAIHKQFEDFYRLVFPTLSSVTHKKEDAIEFIQNAKSRGYNLVIATNPIFPMQAILERIDWAGLNPLDFQLITSYEQYHFAKPNPAYYAEILGVLGWPNEPIIMIGNHPEHDVHAAKQLGLTTFWINEYNQDLSSELHASGTFSDILPWIDQHNLKNTIESVENIESIKATLISTPAALNQIVSEIPEAIWIKRSVKSEWAPVEIICHLRDVDREVNLSRIMQVISQNNPFVAGVDTDPWAEERNYICQDGNEALREFTALRKKIFETISPLTQSDWKKPARHSIFGPTDLREILKIIATHDRLHLHQLVKSLAIQVQ